MDVLTPQCIDEMTSAPETEYCIKGKHLLYYFNKTQGTSGLLCNKPDCNHNDEGCNVLLEFNGTVEGLQYYEGSLYTVTRGEE